MTKAAKVLSEVLKKTAPVAGSRVLIAVSGGADSVALLYSLVEADLGLGLAVAHFDHGLRHGSLTDSAFVMELSEKLGLEFYIRRWRGSLSNEAAAREARYLFLRKLAEEEGFSQIALGHTIEDQVETVIVNLTRGSGLDGLGGMSTLDGLLWRPFLNITHRHLREFLTSRELNWNEDPSNEDRSISRNLVRHEVLPLLSQINSEVVANISRAALILRRQREYLREVGDELANKAWLSTGPWGTVYSLIPLARSKEAALFEALRALWAKAVGWRGYLTSTHLEEMVHLIQGSNEQGAVDLPHRWRIRRSWNKICLFQPPAVPKPPVPLEIESPGRWNWGEYTVQLKKRSVKSEYGSLAVSGEMLPLTLRTREPGDALRLSGTGTKKLKKLFTEARTPGWERPFRPVVADDEGVLWVPGLARDERAAETAELYLTISPNLPEQLLPATEGNLR